MSVNFNQSVNFSQEEKKQKALLVIFIIIVILTFLFVLFFSYFGNKISLPVRFGEDSYYKRIKIDFGIFNNDFLNHSQPFEELPSFEGEKGRDNPFLPY